MKKTDYSKVAERYDKNKFRNDIKRDIDLYEDLKRFWQKDLIYNELL